MKVLLRQKEDPGNEVGINVFKVCTNKEAPTDTINIDFKQFELQSTKLGPKVVSIPVDKNCGN